MDYKSRRVVPFEKRRGGRGFFASYGYRKTQRVRRNGIFCDKKEKNATFFFVAGFLVCRFLVYEVLVCIDKTTKTNQ